MPANEELQLLAKILETGNLKAVLDAGINRSFFKDDGAEMVWGEIVEFFHSDEGRGHVPSLERIKKDCPQVVLPEPGNLPLKSYVKDILDNYAAHVLGTISDDILDNNREKHLDEVISRSLKSLTDLCKERRTSQDILIAEYVKEAAARYAAFESATGFRGIPYPWDPLNVETQGMQPGELIVFYGRPKSMKTWVLLSIAANAYDAWNRRVLLYTREMTPEQMVDRTLCLLINAPYQYYKTGRLHRLPVPEGGTMRDRWNDRLGSIKIEEEACRTDDGHEKTFIITADRDRKSGGAGGGVTGLMHKIQDHRPDLVCVDAAYLMKNDKSGKRSIKWDEQSDIIRDLKDLAMDCQLPILVTTQANRGSEDSRGESMRNIAFADAYGMNCDMAIEINKKATNDPYYNELALSITGAREINMNGFAIHGCAASNFGMLMRKSHNEDGVLITDEEGKPQLEPYVFHQPKQFRDFFKEVDALKASQKKNSKGPSVSGEMSEVFRSAAAKEIRGKDKKGK